MVKANKSGVYKKISSNYIMTKIFDYLPQNKLLNIIHYNKKYQKLMNIKLNDYKNEYLKIKIEIIPKEYKYGKFINISKKNIKIYFNDGKEEINREIITIIDNVSKIKIILNHKIKSLSGLFQDCKYIKKINFIKFKRNNIKNMSYMFSECHSLEEINLSNFNTNNVTNMSHMFEWCFLLKELNLSNFNTNNVTDMGGMFYKCSSLKELNLSNFNTNNVTNMGGMFYQCLLLKN